MTNTYRSVSPLAVHYFGEGTFEREFTPADEKDWVSTGQVELIPRPYKVLSTNFERPRGEVFEAALLVEVEAALLQGGHLERVDRASGGPVKTGGQTVVGDQGSPDQVVPVKPKKKAE